jgi:hypothetical protein
MVMKTSINKAQAATPALGRIYIKAKQQAIDDISCTFTPNKSYC